MRSSALLADRFMRGSDRIRKSISGRAWGLFKEGSTPMVKTFVAAIVLTIGLGGYAVAQDTAPGSPAGTKPMTPEP
jgi:hypothetical protein